jgi:acetate kinase
MFSCTQASEERLGSHEEELAPDAVDEALQRSVEQLGDQGTPKPGAIGHRIVHGGPHRWAPALVDARLLDDLDAAVSMAPRHQLASIQMIHAASKVFPGQPQVACFDTAFHHDLPDVAKCLPVPTRGRPELRRYGFHGLSYESILDALASSELGDRVVVAHLGSGASLAAIRAGHCIDTTMGLTPLGGVPMSTRSGDLDPGVLIHLMRTRGLDADGVERMVDDESGLLAISEHSGDMRVLVARRQSDARAAVAVDLWCYQVRKQIGALSAALGGIDTLVFTAGIGEHAPELRTQICRDLDYLGVLLDEEENGRNAAVISAKPSRCTVRVVPSDENRMVARHTAQLLRSASPGSH